MTKPTTEELAAYLMEQSRIWSEGSHDRELLCAAAARLRELERENAGIRKLAEEWRKRAHNPPGGQTFVYQDVLFPWEEA